MIIERANNLKEKFNEYIKKKKKLEGKMKNRKKRYQILICYLLEETRLSNLWRAIIKLFLKSKKGSRCKRA